MSRTIEEILADANDPAFRRVATARISLVSQALRDEHAALDAQLTTFDADVVSDPSRKRVLDRISEIEAEIEASTVEFRFQCVGHRAWSDLLLKHPPTPAQKKLEKNLDHNPLTFPYEAMALSCVSPVMTAAQVRELDSSPLMDVKNWNELWGACIRANVAEAAPKSLAASILRRNGESARQPTTTGFPEASS